ncbi:MAG: carbohydrate porin [Planctomycetota bacterium]|nr:MAG: carbohydrate porin [Planctomycetota bacterium]
MRHVSSRPGAPIVGALAIAAWAGSPASGQPVAEVEAGSALEEIEFESTPQTLPGREKGPRQRPSAEAPAPREAPESLLLRDRLTGDLFGARRWLEDRGVTVEAGMLHDLSSPLAGGVRRRLNSQSIFDANATADFATLFGWPGATLFVDVQSHTGRQAAQDTGDIQAFNNADAPNFFQLYELWFEQVFAHGRARLKIGKLDANSEFAFVEHGGEFLNSSMGFSPTVLGFPTYPDPAFAAVLFVYPTDAVYAGVGVFDGSTQDGIATGPRGFRTFFADDADEVFIVAEVGAVFALAGGTLPGRVGVGVWTHTAPFGRFDGGTDSGATGFYVVADQLLWRENPDDPDDEQGVGAFFQYGWANENIAEIVHHVGAGAAWTGPIPGRDGDVLGAGITVAVLSDEPGAGFGDDAEIAFEVFYALRLTPAVSVKPDLQLILNPGGDPTISDALVGTLRLEIVF